MLIFPVSASLGRSLGNQIKLFAPHFRVVSCKNVLNVVAGVWYNDDENDVLQTTSWKLLCPPSSAAATASSTCTRNIIGHCVCRHILMISTRLLSSFSAFSSISLAQKEEMKAVAKWLHNVVEMQN